MSDLTKCQFTITLCLQSKNMPRDQSLLLHSGFLVLMFYIAIQKRNIFTFTESQFLFILTLRLWRYVLGFWIHMLWFYRQKLKVCTQLLPYKLQSHLRFLSSLQLKAEHPSSCLGLVSWALHVNTKLGEDLSGCLLTTAGGSRVTENRLSSCLVGKKALACSSKYPEGKHKK